MFELDLTETYIWDRLNDDPELVAVWEDRLFMGAPPQGAAHPLGLVTLQTATDDLAGSNRRTAARVVYLIRTIFEGEDLASGEAAASRVDALLDRSTGDVVGPPSGTILMCRRQGMFSLVEFPQGRRLNHRGAFFEFLTQGTPTVRGRQVAAPAGVPQASLPA